MDRLTFRGPGRGFCKLRVALHCAERPECPIDHPCLRGISAADVYDRASVSLGNALIL